MKFYIGLDIGSTTFKLVVFDSDKKLVFSIYRRHNTNIRLTALEVATILYEKFGNIQFDIVITGSVGMGYANRLEMAFVQEVVAAAEFIEHNHPDVHTFIDMGGEDSKMIFFEDGKVPDIRMNGSCAGGTGAFIDQTATLLDISLAELNNLAATAETIHPIASRCGVFSKTDIQNLISINVSKNDIAASVFNAVALQVVSSLARGRDILPKVFFCGGPFAFLPELKKSFVRILNLDEKDCVLPENAQFIPALGCALLADSHCKKAVSLTEVIALLRFGENTNQDIADRLPAFFKSEEDFNVWQNQKKIKTIPKAELNTDKPLRCFMGIDSGSTTTKIVLLNENGELIYKDYLRNKGDSFKTFSNCLLSLQKSVKHPENLFIAGSAVTGYGENLLKTAFDLDFGVVETMAHFIAAQKVSPDVSFVLDIGGQDMKAIFVENGSIKRIEINEACSSGCGSFIETFANMLHYPVDQFAAISCFAKNPCNLGTRCTVFMNSKVKQSLSEGAELADIAAGFSYSVIKNCLFKVLKLKSVKELGDNIVVQGGTFKNHSIVRALELLTGKSVSFSDIPELMGAYGAAIFAREHGKMQKEVCINQLIECQEYESNVEVCPGCENHCTVKVFRFQHQHMFYSGNNCERVYSNKKENTIQGVNQHQEKYQLLFNRPNIDKTEARLKIGIPRGLGIYENYPFWHALFNACGILPVLSKISTNSLYESGIRSIMADNICFPAKLMHGHTKDLIANKVDRIFYPYVIYEQKEDASSRNSYNCPIVSGYSDVIKSSIEPTENHNIPFDSPVITFNNEKLLKKSCSAYLQTLGIDKRTINKAIRKAVAAQKEYLENLQNRSLEIIQKAHQQGKMVIVLAGRPYHIDPLIQHKISNCIADMGIDVVTENIGSAGNSDIYDELLSVTQWAYPNRIFKAAHYVANADENIHFVQLTSFGCGPDAFILDEMSNILNRKGKNLTILKIDDVNNIGSLRLRIRSLVESLQISTQTKKNLPFCTTAVFTKQDVCRSVIAPYFAEGYSEFLPSIFKLMGYKLINLPKPNQDDAEIGLKFANNEVCYPATIVVGSIIKYLQTNSYNEKEIAIGITQTGGQCRASNYLALIKNAMISAGYSNIPVISVAFGDNSSNNQPGFRLQWGKVINITLHAMFYADCIAKLYHASVVRETQKGIAVKLKDKYINSSFPFIESRNIKGLMNLLKEAVAEFDSITAKIRRPIIGLVGEIYLKYNSFSQKHVIDWLEKQNIEVSVPSIYNFFLCGFANSHVYNELYIKDQKLPLFINDAIYKLVLRIAGQFDNICKSFVYYRPFSNLFHDLKLASQIVNPATNFGEGWLLPAEIANFAENNIANVISLQPFGCIANHVISKGIEKRIKKIYPNMNFLFLDFDSGVSEANIFNRLHFIVENSLKEIKQDVR